MNSHYVHIASYDLPFEAQFVCGLLRDAGIDAILENEHQVTMSMGWANALGGVRLMVPADDAETARQILDAGRDAGGQ